MTLPGGLEHQVQVLPLQEWGLVPKFVNCNETAKSAFRAWCCKHMETRSKTRITTDPDPEPARGTPETSVLQASSESSLDLTVLMDDGEAGVVGPGHPTVTATTTLPGTNLADQARDAAGIDPVREPKYDNGSPSDDPVTERHRAVANPTHH